MTNKYVAIFCSDLYYSGRDSVAANPIIAKNLHIRNFGELFFESSLKASCEAAMKVAAFLELLKLGTGCKLIPSVLLPLASALGKRAPGGTCNH